MKDSWVPLTLGIGIFWTAVFVLSDMFIGSPPKPEAVEYFMRYAPDFLVGCGIGWLAWRISTGEDN